MRSRRRANGRAAASVIAPAALLGMFLLAAPGARAQRGIQGPVTVKQALERISAEAAGFEKLAAEVSGQEKIHQRLLKRPPLFKPRVGEGAKKAPPLAWKDRDIVSLYAIAAVGNGLHEIRQVISVDGKNVQGERRAQDTLARLLTESGDQQKLEALRQLQKYSLGGAATDFGPLILLFAHGGAERYEFTASGPRLLGTVPARAFRFKQLDGSEGLTLFAGQTQRLPIEGEIWIADNPQGPIRITLASTVPGNESPRKNPAANDVSQIAAQGEPAQVREEASVDYARSAWGALLPAHIEQRERHGDDVTAENIFDYGNFQRLADR